MSQRRQSRVRPIPNAVNSTHVRGHFLRRQAYEGNQFISWGLRLYCADWSYHLHVRPKISCSQAF